MLGTALLGSVYAVADDDRAAAVREFVGRVPDRHHPPPHRVRHHHPRGLRRAGAGRRRAPPRSAAARRRRRGPTQLGRVRPTGCYAYGDVYGDQTSYLVTFAYEDGADGGPEHAVVALVDHNIGITKDVFVGASAERILEPGPRDVRRRRADLVPRGGPGPAARRGRPAPGDHRRARRPARRGFAGHRPGAGRGPAGPAAGGDHAAAGRAARRRTSTRAWSATSWPRPRRPGSASTGSPPTTSWPRCTSA